ncbi:uncharacterized protein SCODWIG_02116 [Saccharomycodes ludwigii]|uniref:Aminotransferase class V domain-containing protein n=1 Tax=Saccharomycodes ludwigii TaxID=36035 RepID=A0A376B6P4_9ASCO|nr:hypothetical protein SCDLUD_000446 [Saccharomycodes ludwigii]KAH3902853.1 hypothetical protein SCDLUD_000446 [Saccharomycodes ludwigii]SSD60355.1 uncharacterized protein SCODWIG_02116 [Saccharomycodes ludwigii]
MSVPFGHKFKETYFTYLDKAVVPINHGSYGTTPTAVLDEQKYICEQHEHYPDKYEYFEAASKYIEQVKLLGDYLGLDYHNLALVSNATSGINTILRSFPFDFSKDKILFHSTSYGACANTVKFLHDYYGLQYDVVDLVFPMEDDNEILSKFEKKLSSTRYKMCMFDMISSMPSGQLPYEELIKLCHRYDTLTLIDGAHAAGQVDLSFINELKPDFLVSNLHKWLFVPKSCAFLYVDPKYHEIIQTLPVSWNYTQKYENKRDLLLNKFAKTGTISYSPFLTIGKAIEFRKEVCGGEDRIRKYQMDLQQQAIPVIIKIFGPGAKLLQNKRSNLNPPGMFNIKLPVLNYNQKYEILLKKMILDGSFFASFKQLCDHKMIYQHKVYAPFSLHNGDLWVRFSVQIFNEIDDYVIGAKIVAQVTSKVLDLELAKLSINDSKL